MTYLSWPDDVIRPRPLRPSAMSLRQFAYDVAENLGGEVSCMQCTGQVNDVELVRTVKMETRHPVILVMNFRRSAIIAALWQPEVARR